MPVTLSAMFITVNDPDAALGFYRDALGLEVRNDVSSDGFRWVTVGAPGQDVDIVLSQPHGGRSQAEGDALQALVTQGSLQAAIFRSDDLDTTFEKVRASGAEVLQEPTSQPWGRVTAPSVTPRATSSASPRPDRRGHVGLGTVKTGPSDRWRHDEQGHEDDRAVACPARCRLPRSDPRARRAGGEGAPVAKGATSQTGQGKA